MNIKNNKGITIVTLVITVVILIILATVTVSIGLDLTETAQFENIETNLLLVQSKCKITAEKLAIGEIEEDELYGTLQSGGSYDGWYLLDDEDLYNMGLEDLSASDGYYVDYDNIDVAYEIGIEYNGKTYYKLSEMLGAD